MPLLKSLILLLFVTWQGLCDETANVTSSSQRAFNATTVAPSNPNRAAAAPGAPSGDAVNTANVMSSLQPSSPKRAAAGDVVRTAAPPRNETCQLRTRNPTFSNVIKQMLKIDKRSLIQYRLNFTNYTENPLLTPDIKVAFRPDRWSRVTSAHGQTLLSLAFNYGYLSMSTLTLGTETLDVELVDHPAGCFGAASETAKIEIVQELLMRDFIANGPVKTVDEDRVCHEVILNDDGYGQFRHNCCYVSSINDEIECTSEIGNFWLALLYAMLALVRYGLLAFSPVIFMGSVLSMSKENIPYVVRLKDKLTKSVYFSPSHEPKPKNITFKRELDLRSVEGFSKLIDMAKKLDEEGKLKRKVKVAFDQYDITVDYKRTLRENTVPVGLFQTLFRTLFKCRIRYTGPFKDCCATNMCTLPLLCQDKDSKSRWFPVTWSVFFRQVSKALLVVLVPVPFYIRLMLFYTFERKDVYIRKDALAERGLQEHYETNAIHYFTPSHGFFVCMYVIYVISAVSLAFMSKFGDNFCIKSIIINSFRDLKSLNWTDVLSMAVSNMIWPLKRFGVCGCLVGLIYWPFAGLYSAVISIAYLLPTLYLSFRMCYYAWMGIIVKKRISRRKKYQVRTRPDRDMYKLQAETCVKKKKQNTTETLETDSVQSDEKQDEDCLPLPYPQGRRNVHAIADDVDEVKIEHYQPEKKEESGDKTAAKDEEKSSIEAKCIYKGLDDGEEVVIEQPEYDEDDELESMSLKSFNVLYANYCNWPRVLENVLAAFLAIVTLYTCVIILSEVIGCLVEIITFTIMGVIVNAGTLLKYAMLVLMIFVYCCDCFNNITKKYLKMNKALFNEVRSRISKDLEAETSMPSHLQENRGFKAQELNQQADYEMPDDIALKVQRHWMINDLVMFVDSEDMPRIPRKLFEMVCEIRVAGVPGPVFRGHIEAVTQLIKIILFVVFVFIIVLSFGAVYKVSSTNQMLATLLGGFLPMVLRTFLAPPAPDVELGTVSFRSKMDEVIKNFCQYWPIHDLPFQIIEDEKPEVNSEENAEVGPPSAADVVSTAVKAAENEKKAPAAAAAAAAAAQASPDGFLSGTSRQPNSLSGPLLIPFPSGGTDESGGTAIILNPMLAEPAADDTPDGIRNARETDNNNVGSSRGGSKPKSDGDVVDSGTEVDLFVRLPALYDDNDDCWAPSFTEDKDYSEMKACKVV